MRYKLLLLDIDGTLRPGSCEQIPKENAAAVRAVQKAGVKIAIATGRGRTGVGKGLLRDLKPDYWVCAGGAQLVDAKGNDLALHRLTAEEMYALVDFFEDYELPLRFTFHDANYAYIDFAEFDRREKAKNLYNNIVDGEDQDHHLVEMPFGCFGFLPREQAAQFQEKYGYLGLFLFVAIPLPGTGAWTGSLIAVLFGMKPKKSLLFIFLGVLTAGLIMSLLSFGVLKQLIS